MAWTQADVEAIEAAIVKAATDGFADITVGNISMRRYTLQELANLRQVVKSAVGGGDRFTLASYSKE